MPLDSSSNSSSIDVEADARPSRVRVSTGAKGGGALSRDVREQHRRLEHLERELMQLKHDMLQPSQTPAALHVTPQGAVSRTTTTPCEEQKPDKLDSPRHSSAHPHTPSHRPSLTLELAEAERQSVLYELSCLVPHLSAEFQCSTRDAVLITASIRHGGASGGPATLMDKLSVAESERRGVEQRLEKKTAECEAVKGELAAARRRIQAVQEHARQTNELLSRHKEELRHQLLLEEGRTQKLQVRNRKLEVENEQLKERLRGRLR